MFQLCDRMKVCPEKIHHSSECMISTHMWLMLKSILPHASTRRHHAIEWRLRWKSLLVLLASIAREPNKKHYTSDKFDFIAVTPSPATAASQFSLFLLLLKSCARSGTTFASERSDSYEHRKNNWSSFWIYQLRTIERTPNEDPQWL